MRISTIAAAISACGAMAAWLAVAPATSTPPAAAAAAAAAPAPYDRVFGAPGDRWTFDVAVRGATEPRRLDCTVRTIEYARGARLADVACVDPIRGAWPAIPAGTWVATDDGLWAIADRRDRRLALATLVDGLAATPRVLAAAPHAGEVALDATRVQRTWREADDGWCGGTFDAGRGGAGLAVCFAPGRGLISAHETTPGGDEPAWRLTRR